MPSLQQHVLLLYRSEGHLRFSLPELLRLPENAAALVAGLRAMEGIYRVDLSRQGKLSIRYLDTVSSFAAVVRRLHALVGQAPVPEAATASSTAGRRPSVPKPMPASGAPSWLKDKAEEARETVQAMGILAQQGIKALEKRPRWINEFLTDLLMLYLIKVHWHAITQHWLLNPWRYRYEWAATFYLIYLQVKSRLQP